MPLVAQITTKKLYYIGPRSRCSFRVNASGWSTMVEQSTLEFEGLNPVDLGSMGRYYKTFYGRNLRIFNITESACPWQAFPA
jgi:hypothetical protein